MARQGQSKDGSATTRKSARVTAAAPPSAPKPKRAYVSQSDVPRYPLQDALRVARAIADQYGKQPVSPLDVAVALDMKPSTGPFRSLCGAALAYGITDGGPNAAQIGLTDLGRRVVAPTEEGDDQRAMREALLKPRVIGEFLGRYNGSKLPTKKIGQNVLETMGVAADATDRTFDLMVSGARSLGLLREIKGDEYVQLDPSIAPAAPATDGDGGGDARRDTEDDASAYEAVEAAKAPTLEASGVVVTDTSPSDLKTNRRVFITHGKNKKIVDQLKELLTFGDFEPIVSVERESVSKPVPDKVLDDMRSCGAAVIHVGTDQRLLDSEGNEHRVINQNVLIEIGAAMMRYGRNFILLVEQGTALPSNLQGLYEVRYEGDELDYPATMKLLKAFNEFKS
jgi:predicted nucleotide-binding protein